jgi:hypothetical protein
MAVTITQIDGQNTGLRLTGQLSIDALSLNLTTGDVTSGYIPAIDLPILRQFALRLFAAVPPSARPAGAVGLLNRLCAVSPADASTITLTASLAGDVATLVATVAAAPASIILTVPFAPSGGVMPGLPAGGSGPSTDTSLTTVLLSEALNPGDPVALQAGFGVLARADNVARMPAVGVIDSLIDPTTARVRVAGVFGSGAGYTAGAIHFVSSTGTISSTPPVTAGHLVQGIGFGFDASTLAVAPSTAMTIR